MSETIAATSTTPATAELAKTVAVEVAKSVGVTIASHVVAFGLLAVAGAAIKKVQSVKDGHAIDESTPTES